MALWPKLARHEVRRPVLVKARFANAQAIRLTVAASSTAAAPLAQSTEEGTRRLVASKTTHGCTIKAERAKAKHRAEVGRQVRRELKEIEQWAVDHGHLAKDWRDQFK